MESHLLQMRGLKLGIEVPDEFQLVSHLLQMRGLKRSLTKFMPKMKSRIFYRCVD